MIERAEAERRDAADPLRDLRAAFEIASPEPIYLDGNSLGRLPKRTSRTPPTRQKSEIATTLAPSSLSFLQWSAGLDHWRQFTSRERFASSNAVATCDF